MICPRCRFEVPAGAKFCNECGHKLEICCPECSRINPSGSKFCLDCGHQLTRPLLPPSKELSLDQKIEKLQKYLPQGLTEKILTQRDRIEGERKQVTVMFCDMEGFTGLAEKIGPEEAYIIMDKVYEILIHQVHHYEGTVNELTGDGIMALFGAPIALEDAPQRAVRSSLAIHREITSLNAEFIQTKKDISPVKMRIGIHTGPVVVGTVGNDLRVEFKAVGDTVNLASRIESLAAPGTTLITENTLKLTEGLFRVEFLGEKNIKGKQEPVNIYRVIAAGASKTRFDARAERGLTPFIGRERELELLLDCFERSQGERGQAVSIVAEAGIGKSRLLYEFRNSLTNESVNFIEGKCLSYSRGVAYNPVIDILKSSFNIDENDDGIQITEKVKNGLKRLKIASDTTLPYLLDLMSVKGSGIEQIPVSPDEKKERTKQAFKKVVLKSAELQTLVIAVEDLHWIDQSSEDIFKEILESISGSRVLLIFTYRPEFILPWGARSYHSQVSLNRFSNRETLLMVSTILNGGGLGKDLAELILAKTEGVPFFIEEFIKSLIDLKLLRRNNDEYALSESLPDMNIPSTIHDVIMARVDSLPDGAKEILQTASAIEREFSYELIKRITGLSEQELLSQISILKNAELLYERGIFPQSIYIFKHALTQDVVYDSILKQKQKKLHEAVGSAIEEMSTENIETRYAALARHFIEAENYKKGSKYSELATRAALGKSSYKDAIEQARNSIFCLERMPKTEENLKNLIDIRTALARYYMSLNYHVEAKDAVYPIVALAEEMDYQKSLSGIYAAMGSYYLFVEEDISKGGGLLDKTITIAQNTENRRDLWFATFFKGMGMFSNGEYDRGFNLLGKAEEISKAADSQSGIGFVKNTLCLLECLTGNNNDQTYRSSQENLKMAEAIDDIFFSEPAHTSYGMACFFKRKLEEAEYHLLKALALSEKTGHISWGAASSQQLAEVYLERKEYPKARQYLKTAISLLESKKYTPSSINLYKLQLITADILNRDRHIDLSEPMEFYHRIKTKSNKVFAMIPLIQILLNIDDQYIGEAQGWIEKAILTFEQNHQLWFLAAAHVLYADFFRRKGDPAKSRANLTKAIDSYRQCRADGWVDKYEKELAEL